MLYIHRASLSLCKLVGSHLECHFLWLEKFTLYKYCYDTVSVVSRNLKPNSECMSAACVINVLVIRPTKQEIGIHQSVIIVCTCYTLTARSFLVSQIFNTKLFN